MDNFMDKLAKRFNAGEIIQANGEAEARENQRLREQMDEYDKIMQEIRRLNLKTIEVSEQVSQMAACSIEQLESYEAQQALPQNDENALSQEDLLRLTGKMDETTGETKKAVEDAAYRLEASLSQVEAMLSRVELGNDTNHRIVESAIRNLEQVLSEEIRDAKEEKAVLDVITAQMTEQSKVFTDQVNEQQESAKQIKEMIVNIRLYMDEVQKHIEDYVHKEDVKVYRNVQAVLMEQLSAKTRDLNDHMDQIEKEMEKTKGTKGLIVFAILLSGASLVVQLLQMFGIF